MKKQFGKYAAAWGILLAVFNIICFVTPQTYMGYSKFDGAFWAGYCFITLAFIGQLICAWFAFQADDNQKFFYNIPLIRISYSGLILMLVVGGAVMAVPNLPTWMGIIVCTLIPALQAIAVIRASAAADLVSETDERVKTRTRFVKLSAAKAQNIQSRAVSELARAACRRVCEALRYADPVSSDALSTVEARITVKLDELEKAVSAEGENVETLAEELVLLVKERGNMCKALK